MRPSVSNLDRTLTNAERSISAQGWYGVYFNEEEPAWEHSIGFPVRLGAPEIIVFGLEYEVSHALIFNTFRAFSLGQQIADHSVVGGIIQGFDCQYRAVHPIHVDRHLSAAKAYHDRNGAGCHFQAFQLIWPDQNGYFPWEEDCHPDIAALQPLLYRADIG